MSKNRSELSKYNRRDANRWRRRVENQNKQMVDPNNLSYLHLQHAKNYVSGLRPEQLEEYLWGEEFGLGKFFKNLKPDREIIARELLPYVNFMLSEINTDINTRKTAMKRIEAKRNSLPASKEAAKQLLEQTRQKEGKKLRILELRRSDTKAIKKVLQASANNKRVLTY